jgi:hypothetical protein
MQLESQVKKDFISQQENQILAMSNLPPLPTALFVTASRPKTPTSMSKLWPIRSKA